MSAAPTRTESPPDREKAPAATGTISKKAAGHFDATHDTAGWLVNPPSGWSSREMKDRRGRHANQHEQTYLALHRVVARTTDAGRLTKAAFDAAHHAELGALHDVESDEYRSFPWNTGGPASGVNTPLGRPGVASDPDPTPPGPVSSPTLGDIESIRLMRRGQPSVVVALDSEWCDLPLGGRRILSYQFAVLDPRRPWLMHEFVFLPEPGDRLRLETLMSTVIEVAELWHSELAPEAFGAGGVSRELARVWSASRKSGGYRFYRTLDKAIKESEYPAEQQGLEGSRVAHTQGRTGYRKRTGTAADVRSGVGCGWQYDDKRLLKHALPVTLVAHFAKADISTFIETEETDLRRHCAEVGGGVVSLGTVDLLTPTTSMSSRRQWSHHYPIRLEVRDTTCLAPPGMKALDNLGDIVGLPKLSGLDHLKSRMDVALRDHGPEFLEYGVRDVEIALEYCSALWGDNESFPVTLSAAAAKGAQRSLMDFFDVEKSIHFKEVFAGMTTQDDGLSVDDSDGVLGWVREAHLAPVDPDAMLTQQMHSYSYRGGYNACFEVGWIPRKTYDFDLKNAYPTAMALIVDVDFLHPDGCIEAIYRNQQIDFETVPSPTTPFCGFVTFEFPGDVTFPTLPVKVNGSVFYPQTSDGVAGVYAAAPEIYLALQLGARIFCRNGVRTRPLRREERGRGVPELSRSLRYAVKRLIADRDLVKATDRWGKGSLPDLMLKIAVNSLYGKTAQDVSPHNTWNAYTQEMEEIGGSAISSAYHANMTTSLVRAVLLATLNQLDELDYRVYSVTTDGFITDAREDVVSGLDLYGFAEQFHEAREALTGQPDMWEIKHVQGGPGLSNDRPRGFLNWKTRGNTSPEVSTQSRPLAGVNAHGGLKLPDGVIEDSQEDRDWMIDLVASRIGRVQNNYHRFSGFRDMSIQDVSKRKDFERFEVVRRVELDFDLKRRPVMETMTTDVVDYLDSRYEIAHFETAPWRTIDEFLHAREVKKSMKVLRTENDWRTFDMRFRNGQKTGRTIRDAGYEIIKTLVKGERFGLWTIPALMACRTRADRVEWINGWCMTPKKVTVEGLKTMTRADRQHETLDLDEYPIVSDWLERWQAQPVGVSPMPFDEPADADHGDIEGVA